MIPFFKSDFKFSEKSINWINNNFNFLFSDPKVCEHALIRTFKFESKFGHKVSFKDSPVLEELQNYLENFGIPKEYFINEKNGPDVFLANNVNVKLHSPHIDETLEYDDKFPGGVKPVLTRFNSFIKYSPYEDMWWWENVVPGSPLIDTYETKEFVERLGIKGKTSVQKLSYLGPPSHVAKSLYLDTSSAFIKTDCAHSISLRSPGIRFGITVALDKTIEELLEYNSTRQKGISG